MTRWPCSRWRRSSGSRARTESGDCSRADAISSAPSPASASAARDARGRRCLDDAHEVARWIGPDDDPAAVHDRGVDVADPDRALGLLDAVERVDRHLDVERGPRSTTPRPRVRASAPTRPTSYVVRPRTAPRPDEYDEHEQGDTGRDQEPPVADPLHELAAGDDRNRPADRAHRPAEDLGERRAHDVERPHLAGRPGRVEHLGGLGADQLQDRSPGQRVGHPDAREPLVPARRGSRPPRRAPAAVRRPPQVRRRRRRPRSSSMDQPDRLAGQLDEGRAGGWRTAPAAGRVLPARTAGQDVHADGVQARERLVQDEDLGRWTRRAASWTRCWFPSESVWTPASEAIADPEDPAWSLATPGPWRPRIEPVQPREVSQRWSSTRILRGTAALLRHVAEPPPDRASTGRPRHAPRRRRPGGRRARSHRGGLARAVRSDEADHLAGRYRERDVVQRDDGAEPARRTGELEHGIPRRHGETIGRTRIRLQPRTRRRR